MKTINITLVGLMVSGAFAHADDGATDFNKNENRLTLSARLGFNVRAKFSNRLTPDGLPYNYLDGYVLPDSTGDFDPTGTFNGITQNWGYDNSTRQRDLAPTLGGFPTVAMTRFASGVDPMTGGMQDDPLPGLELGYMRRLGTHKNWHYGIEVAVNFQKLDLSESGTINGTGVQDYYPYFNGTQPYDSPYQGRFNNDGNGIRISNSFDPLTSTQVPVSLNAHREFEADIWGFRLGPYLERKFGRRLVVNAVGGLAVAVVDGEASWRQALTVGQITDPTVSGSSCNTDVLWGYYVGANATYHISRRWDITSGIQYQDVGIYKQDVGARKVELDLSRSIFLQIGISYSF